jgi:hypothetical protein
VCAGLATAGWPTRVVAGDAPVVERPEAADEAEALLAQADADRAAGRWAAAASAFDRAFHRLPVQLVPELGESTVLLAVAAYERDAEISGRVEPLEAAAALLEAFAIEIEAVGDGAPPSDAFFAARQRISDALPAPAPAPEPAPESIVADDHLAQPRPDPLGWALVGAGGAVAFAGIATLARGARMLPIAKRRLDDRGPDLIDPAADDAYLDENRRRGRIAMGLGGAVAVVGLAAVVVGALRVTKDQDRRRARVEGQLGGLLVRF